MKNMTVRNALTKVENPMVKEFLDLWLNDETDIHLDECSKIFQEKEDFAWGVVQHLYNTTSYVGTLDWKADDDEFSYEIEGLLSEAGLDLDDYPLDINCDEGDGVYEWLQYVEYVINKDGFSLISFDTGSDQYVFTIVKLSNARKFKNLFNELAGVGNSHATAYRVDAVKQIIEEVVEEVIEEVVEEPKVERNPNNFDIKLVPNKSLYKDTCFIGEYPQSLVDDTNIISQLDNLSGDRTDGIYELNGSKYIKQIVKVNPSTLRYTFYSSLFNNGSMAFDGDTAYFKFEPLEWIVIETNTKRVRLLCLNAIAQSIVDESEKNREVKGIADNYSYYEHSKLRKFLNGSFYDLAFSDIEKGLILTMTVDNSPKSTSSYAMGKDFKYKDTEDKVHTLSYKEAKKTDWGFTSGEYSYSDLRIARVTDYAFAQGLTKSKNGGVSWCLRSPSTYASSDGQTVCREERDSTSMGARPVICLDKKKINLI